jgi:hypothetical protein
VCTNNLVCESGSCQCNSSSCPACQGLQTKCCVTNTTCGCAILGLICL